MNQNYVRRLARNAFQHVAHNRMLARHYQARYQWYRRLLECKGMLEAQLRERVQGLAAP
jgi:hypothetical protein